MWKSTVVCAALVGVIAFSWSRFDAYVDKVEFFDYVQSDSTLSQRDHDWMSEHEDLVLADGHAYCNWLGQFPKVPEVVPSGDADVGKFRTRYLSATAASTKLAVSDRARRTVVAAAGAYFCRGTVSSRTSFAVPEEQL